MHYVVQGLVNTASYFYYTIPAIPLAKQIAKIEAQMKQLFFALLHTRQGLTDSLLNLLRDMSVIPDWRSLFSCKSGRARGGARIGRIEAMRRGKAFLADPEFFYMLISHFLYFSI